MNPAYDPFNPMDPRVPQTPPPFQPSGSPNLFTSQASPGRYYGGGNIGQSAPGSKSPTGNPVDPKGLFGFQGTYDQWRAEQAKENPWMEDTSIQWGGGPSGYLPIGYQAQPLSYYQQADAGGNVAQGPFTQQGAHGRWRPSGGYAQMAPWEQRYAADTWTQNFAPGEPGYINTRNR